MLIADIETEFLRDQVTFETSHLSPRERSFPPLAGPSAGRRPANFTAYGDDAMFCTEHWRSHQRSPAALIYKPNVIDAQF